MSTDHDYISERTGRLMPMFRFVRTSRLSLTASQVRAMQGHYQRGENEADALQRLIARKGRPDQFERYVCDPSH